MATQQRGGRGVILDAAVGLFNDVGYHGASIRDIAKKAGVTVASIYYHFSSKQEILQDIMVRILTDVIADTRRGLAGAGPDPREQLDALVRCWILFHINRQHEAMIGSSEIRSLDEVGRDRVVPLRDEQERIFREVVERGVADGVFLTSHPRQAARAILDMGRSIVTWYRADGASSPDAFAKDYAEMANALVRAVTRAT